MVKRGCKAHDLSHKYCSITLDLMQKGRGWPRKRVRGLMSYPINAPASIQIIGLTLVGVLGRLEADAGAHSYARLPQGENGYANWAAG
jgi:hypothetical protein